LFEELGKRDTSGFSQEVDLTFEPIAVDESKSADVDGHVIKPGKASRRIASESSCTFLDEVEIGAEVDVLARIRASLQELRRSREILNGPEIDRLTADENHIIERRDPREQLDRLLEGERRRLCRQRHG
jgi:hypothetical protein